MSLSDFQLSYEISPIILTGGSSSGVPGGMTPIVSLLQPGAFSDGLPGDGAAGSLDDYFARFVVLPGGSLINNAVGEYPFANQGVAANAIIVQPLDVSLLMICPVQKDGWSSKLSTITNLKASIDAHVNQGGTFTVATPSFLYENVLLLKIVDATDGESKQVQTAWQWFFYKPLLSLADAAAAQNNLMSKISGGTPVDGDPPAWSGTSPSVGNPASAAAPSTVPAASGLVGSSAASPTRSAGTDRFAP